MNFCQNLKMPKGAKPAPVRTFIQKALRVQITNNLVEGYFLKVVKKNPMPCICTMGNLMKMLSKPMNYELGSVFCKKSTKYKGK